MATTSSPILPPECFTFPARMEHTATVILLHGLGDSARYFALAFNDLKNHPDLDHVKFIFPSARPMAVTGNMNTIMPTWFDCYSFDILNRKEDEKGLFQSARWVKDIIAKEEKEHNIPSDRIIVGGLSQGGAVSILTTLTIEKPIAGLLALSTYIPLRSRVPEFATALANKIPILWCHGTDDKQVNCEDWKRLAEVLTGQLSIPFVTSENPAEFATEKDGVVWLEFRTYVGMGHWIEPPELEDVAAWIGLRVPRSRTPL